MLAAIFYVFGNEPTNTIRLNTDSIINIEKKVEFLISTSKKVEKLDLTLSLDAIAQAHNLSLKSNNDYLIAQCNHQLGIVLSKNNDTEEALTNLKKALAFFENSGNNQNITSILLDIGQVYFRNDQFSKSLMYYNSALSEFSGMNDSLGIVTCYTYIGQVNSSLGNYQTAAKFFKDAIYMAKVKKYNYYAALNYLLLSKIEIELGLMDSILSQVSLVIKIAENDSFPYLKADAFLILNHYYTAIDNELEAAAQLHNFIMLQDSLNLDKSTALEKFLISISNENATEKKMFGMKFVFWLLITVMFIIVFLLLFKIRNKRKIHNDAVNKSTSELEAFKLNISNLSEKVEQKTKYKILEIEQEISSNESTRAVLNNSLKNLDNINNLKDTFLSKISHEIRTPLNSILGFSSMLETELVLLEDNTLLEFSTSITQSGLSLVSLLNNILDISRLNSNKMALDIKRQNTKELIQSAVDKYFHEASLKRIKLIYDSQDIPEIHTDNQLFAKILSLILSNSVKFTEKGFIKISHDYDDKKNMINIFVKDTGIGIDKVYIDQVFEPFRQESLGYSTSYQGAGLGLPLAKKMTLKVGGNINIESEKGSGTTIILSFPAYKSDPEIAISDKIPEVGEVSIKETMPWEPLSVLVVEDDTMNQILFRKMLKKAHHLDIAKDGKTAFALVEKQLNSNNYQLVLMDINLPAPWDGISLMKEIRTKWPVYNNIPFIAQTAYAISGNRQTMMGEGFDEYITKPIIKSSLIKSINTVISS
ncbi:MAG: response regulator [Bacteroidetes bacterium]|nr:response regulator [Bacteroidota bacterium]